MRSNPNGSGIEEIGAPGEKKGSKAALFLLVALLIVVAIIAGATLSFRAKSVTPGQDVHQSQPETGR